VDLACDSFALMLEEYSAGELDLESNIKDCECIGIDFNLFFK
jgi:hypothetical protein